MTVSMVVWFGLTCVDFSIYDFRPNNLGHQLLALLSFNFVDRDNKNQSLSQKKKSYKSRFNQMLSGKPTDSNNKQKYNTDKMQNIGYKLSDEMQ